MPATFVDFYGLPIRITRIRSMMPSSANDLTMAGADTNHQFFICPRRLTGLDILKSLA